jgi:AcrR family transcriptional regulator
MDKEKLFDRYKFTHMGKFCIFALNMETVNSNTEQKILDSAQEIFHEKGYDGARMQEIADKANINKGLLHYYFKTKDSLFETVFSITFRKVLGQLESILLKEIPLEEKIDLIVDGYMDMLSKNASLPRFVMNELSKNPDQFIAKHINNNMKKAFSVFERTVQEEIEAHKIRPIDPRQLCINLISMSIFPFMGKPILQVVVGVNNKEFQILLQERRDHIKAFIKQAIKL